VHRPCILMQMSKPPALCVAVFLLTGIAGASCRTAGGASDAPIVQPGPPGQDTKVISVEKAVDLSRVGHTPADVRFMQEMIGHHGQALEMTALIPSRTSREEMKQLGQRIEISQADEIKMMQTWLKDRGQTAPDVHAHHAHGAKLMPGMLTPEEMKRLSDAKGVEFDRLFLEGMIKHHEGALTMVKDLFDNNGAGQESEVFAFVADVEADQQMEIDRMFAMLKELQK
jgi:uncharacterized protein (DUF305 family)